MSVKTVRFNKKEEVMLKKILAFYGSDFSSCIKELMIEKLEDLQDIKVIQTIKEGKKSEYLKSDDLDQFVA